MTERSSRRHLRASALVEMVAVVAVGAFVANPTLQPIARAVSLTSSPRATR